MTNPGRDVLEVFIAVFKGTLFLDSEFLFQLSREMLETVMPVKLLHSPPAGPALVTFKLVFGRLKGHFRDRLDIISDDFGNRNRVDFG